MADTRTHALHCRAAEGNLRVYIAIEVLCISHEARAKLANIIDTSASHHAFISFWYIPLVRRRFPVSLCMHTHSYTIRIFRYFLQQSVLHSSVFTQHTHANTRIIRAAAAKLARYEIRNKPIPWFVNTQATHKQQLLYVRSGTKSSRTKYAYQEMLRS